MSSLAVANTLASVLVPIGNAGAVLAIVCSLVTAFALARGAAGLAGGGGGVWILGAMLSLCASFASVWTPVIVSVGALAAAFVVGTVVRVLLRRVTRAATPASVTAAPVISATAQSAPAEPARHDSALPVRGIQTRAITETVRVAS
ncbi:hypothetical protein ACIPV2_09505 [Microbacterium sp. NPDC089987]|uniref:hypothetical protein n=1 Tax=Microbacterium sp. NPDC089987 TaxID=3364202 RepID=UPI00382BB3AC